jgi:hypothetical protein
MFEKNRDMDRATVRAAGSWGRNLLFSLIISFLFLAGQTAHSIAASLNGNGYYGNGLNGNGYYGNGLNGNGYYGNSQNGTGLPIILKSIAILPLENLSEEPGATDIVTEFIKEELKGKGWVLITKSDTVEQFLAKRRIRYTGAITRLTVREMGKVLGIDAVLVGSITQFSTHNGKATVGVLARPAL